MINQVLEHAFNLKNERKRLNLGDYCSLLYLLSLYENAYLSSLQMISTTIEETLRNDIKNSSDEMVIENSLRPILLSYLTEIWDNSSSSTNNST